jgi:hypothetical protein
VGTEDSGLVISRPLRRRAFVVAPADRLLDLLLHPADRLFDGLLRAFDRAAGLAPETPRVMSSANSGRVLPFTSSLTRSTASANRR